MSVMGVYQSDMIFPTTVNFPTTIAKFAVLIKYYEIPDAFTDDLEVRIFLPGDPKDTPTFSVPFPRANLGKATFPTKMEEDQERVFNLTFPSILSPLRIKQEGFVKVRIVCGALTTNLGSLFIRTARPDEKLQF
jgi:hypothetical protein